MSQQRRQALAPQDTPRLPAWIRAGFWIAILISAGVAIRRVIALANPAHSGPPQMAGLDDAFASHTALTLAHILPALLFVLLTPLIVLGRNNQPRWVSAIFYPLGTIVGLTAYAMSLYSIGGWTERSAVLLFDSLFLLSLARAFIFHSRADITLERRWQLRAIAILLGIATTRPVMGVFFATSSFTHLLPRQFFGIAFWIGFSINVLIFELWMRSVDRHRERAPRSQVHSSPLRSGI